MAGEWKSTDLVAVLTILAPALNHLVPTRTALAQTARDRRSAGRAAIQPGTDAAQYRRALRRCVQRSVHRVPRRDHDVLERAVRSPARVLARPGPSAATQDRPTAGCGRRRTRHPTAGGRHRMGRIVYPRGRPRRRRPLRHPLGSPEVAGPPTNHRCRQIRSGAHRSVRLSRHRRTLRRRDFGGDGRGRGASLMAGFPEHPGPAGQTRRARGDPGDHHATRGDARHPQQPDLDPEVHLPRRTDSVSQSSARNHAAGQHITLVRHDLAGRPLRGNTAALAGAIYATPKDAVAHRLRRGLRADVGAVPGGPGGRIPVGQPQRLSVDVRQPNAAP